MRAGIQIYHYFMAMQLFLKKLKKSLDMVNPYLVKFFPKERGKT